MVRSPKSLAVALAGSKFVGHLVVLTRKFVGENSRVRTSKEQVCEKWTLTSVTLNSLIPAKNSLFLEIISLLIFVGNLPGNRCGTGAFRADIASKSLGIAKFPVNFPVSRELQAETGSYLTAHTTKLFK
jgi:hypothetical protein